MSQSLHRINDQLSRADLVHSSKSQTSSDQDSNIEDNMKKIQNNIRLLYETNQHDEALHLGSYGVQGNTSYISQIVGSNKKHPGFSSFKKMRQNEVNHDELLLQYDTAGLTSSPNEEYMEDLLRQRNQEISALKRTLLLQQTDRNNEETEVLEQYKLTVQNLRQENYRYLQDKINIEATCELQEKKIDQIQLEVSEKDQIIIQYQQQMQNFSQQIIEKEDKIQVLQQKNQIYKEELQNLQLKIREVESQQKGYSDQAKMMSQQNSKLKNIISGYQDEQRNRSQSQEAEKSRTEEEYYKMCRFIDDIMQTLSQFVQNYIDGQNQGSDNALSQDLQKCLYSFVTTQDTQKNRRQGIIVSLQKIADLTISTFEQLQLQEKQIKTYFLEKNQHEKQIIQLESIIVSLEKQLIQAQSQNEHMEKLIQKNDQLSLREKDEILQIMVQRTKDQTQLQNLEAALQNIENINMELQREKQSGQKQLEELQDELSNSRKFLIEEQNRVKYQEHKVKKLYQDWIFYRDIVQRLSGILAGDQVVVESLLESQKNLSVCQQDEIELRNQLQSAEAQLKNQISQNQLTTRDMMERRKEVEELRSAQRNCEDQCSLFKEQLERLYEELEKIIIFKSNTLSQQDFLPSYGRQTKNIKDSTVRNFQKSYTQIDDSENNQNTFNNSMKQNLGFYEGERKSGELMQSQSQTQIFKQSRKNFVQY